MIESTYSVSSLLGFVSSNRKLHLPPNSRASPKFRWIDLACPMCRYPFGSGGNRVCTRPPYLLVFRSSMTISRTKLDGPAVVSGNSELVVLIGIYSRAFAFRACPGTSSTVPNLNSHYQPDCPSWTVVPVPTSHIIRVHS